ncbi:MAG: tetratricopeptide repeat protein [Nitrospinae bacterium]|nr:tetratricopeptide repeat protein [Nitrospinota bacterium]
MKKYLPPLILIAAVVLVYGNTLHGSFQFDDEAGFLRIPYVRSEDIWDVLKNKIPQYIFSWNQRPLVILSYNINYAISEMNTWSYQVFNILMHVLVVLAVYALAGLSVRLATERESSLAAGGSLTMACKRPIDRDSAPLPFLAALIFALHPLNTQTVAYIASRSAAMATLFYLWALFLLFKGLETKRPFWRFACPGFALVFLACGALSKETVITFPALAFLFHFYFVSSKSFPRWFKENLKWFGGIGGVLAAGILVKMSKGQLLQTSPTPYSAADYFLTQTFVVPFEYFWKMFFPINLGVDIPFPAIFNWGLPTNYLGILVLCGYTAVLALASRTRPWIGFGMAWALIAVLPESSFVPLLDLETEHRTYLPMAGFSVFFASLICLLARRLREKMPAVSARRFSLETMCWGTVVLIALLFAAGTARRNLVWKDEVSLWADAVKKAPRSIRPYNNLGEAYDRLGRYDEALAGFKAALEIKPDYFFALNNIGNIYGKLGEPLKAIEYLKKAVAVRPDYPIANYNLAMAYQIVGERGKALAYYRKAAYLDSYFDKAFFNLAQLALEINLLDESIKNFVRYIELRPGDKRAHFQLGNAYLRGKQYDLALEQYKKSLEMDPNYPFPYINMGAIYMEAGRFDEAMPTYEKILARFSIWAGAHKNLGMIYYKNKHDRPRALHHFAESLRLEPTQPEAALLQTIIAALRAELKTGAG